MEFITIKNALNKKRKGTFTRICWKSEPKLSAQAKKQGYNVVKIVESTVRFGVKYNNIKSVKLRKAETETSATNTNWTPWYSWEEPNTFKRHNKTDKLYLTVATTKNSNTRVKYLVNGKEVTKEELQNMNIILNSYWNDKVSEVFDLKVENIIFVK